MISKELLRAVSCVEVADDEHLSIRFNDLCVEDETYGGYRELVNIHELAHMVKEWSIKQGYIIVEFPLMVRTTNISTQQNKIFDYTPQEELDKDYLKPEYIFKAGEWILEEIQKWKYTQIKKRLCTS